MDQKSLSNDTVLSLEQCFYCSGWFRPRYMLNVLFSGIPQRVCMKCRRQIEKIQKEMELEVKKQEEEDAMENETPETLGFGS